MKVKINSCSKMIELKIEPTYDYSFEDLYNCQCNLELEKNEIYSEKKCNEKLSNSVIRKINKELVNITEDSFNTNEDNRTFNSRLYDIDRTNNFKNYVKDFWDYCDNENVFDDY